MVHQQLKTLYQIVQQSVMFLTPEDYLSLSDDKKQTVALNIINIIEHTTTFRYKLRPKAIEEVKKILNDTIDHYKLIDTKYLELLKLMLIKLNEQDITIQ